MSDKYDSRVKSFSATQGADVGRIKLNRIFLNNIGAQIYLVSDSITDNLKLKNLLLVPMNNNFMSDVKGYRKHIINRRVIIFVL